MKCIVCGEEQKGANTEQLNVAVCINPKCAAGKMNIFVIGADVPLDKLLAARGSKYGDVNVQAAIFTGIMDAMNQPTRLFDVPLRPAVRQSLYMIALKMSRIVAGQNADLDNWTDIQGYAKLGALSIPPALIQPGGVNRGVNEVGQEGNQR